MLRCVLVATSLLTLGSAREDVAVPTDQDGEADETCALQLQKQGVNCGGHTAASCQQCPQGNGPTWCHGDCQWDMKSNQCVKTGPKACCKAYSATCLACAADLSVEEYCQQNQGKDIPGCPSGGGNACCLAYSATCLACGAGMSVEEYCQQNQGKNIPGCPSQPPPSPSPGPICALCETCGGKYPESGGRITYFRDEKTEFSSYSEQCSGQERTRTPDNSVVFSPQLCCTRGIRPMNGLLQTEQKEASSEQVEVRAHTEVDVGSNSSLGGNGWCRLCDACGSGYDVMAGEITQLVNPPANSDSNSQNYERHEGQCLSTGGTRGAPPAAKVCCLRSPNPQSGTCAVCQTTCGGAYPMNGGALSYTTNGKKVKFLGYNPQCSGDFEYRTSTGSQNAPRLCCAA